MVLSLKSYQLGSFFLRTTGEKIIPKFNSLEHRKLEDSDPIGKRACLDATAKCQVEAAAAAAAGKMN